MMLKIQFYVFLVLVTLSVVFGAVSFDPVTTEGVYGKTVRYCSYKGLKMLPRSRIKNYDTCERCKCTRRGLSCATLSTAFTVNYPANSKCISVRIGCRNRWVKRNNNNRRCPRRHIPKDISMVGK